jgi:type II secretory pathway pseudopilin PulG
VRGYAEGNLTTPLAVKTKGFTLVELVVAFTLLIILSTISTTSTYDFVHATANLKAQSNNIRDIMDLHSALINAKMNYATDLALEIAGVTNAVEAQVAIQNWNTSAQQNNSRDLIDQLINPDPKLADLPRAPLNPGSRSYLPTSLNGVQITDIKSLLQAYQLTDNGTPTGNIVATISVGSMLEVTSSGTVIRPMLPIIDWKSGTPQEIQY